MTRPFLTTGILEINVLELRNRFDVLQEKTEKRTPNDEYEDFVNAHFEAAVKCIPTKPMTKSRVPWEKLAVREKRANVKIASKCNRKTPTNDSVEDRQSRIAWQRINEVSRRKSTTKAKLEATNQQERIKLWE